MPDDFVISGYASAAEIASMKEEKPTEQQPVTEGAQPAQAQPQPAETAKVEEAPKVEQPAQQQAQPAPVQQPVQSADFWKEVTPESFAAKYKDKRDDVLKALGLNEFLVDAIKYYDRTGNLAEYAEVKGVDYSKMSDDEIIRKNLRQEFAHLELSQEDMDMLYETRITNRFKTDAEQFSEKEVKIGKMEMRLEADRLRKQYIETQKKFVAPERVQEEQPDLQAEILKVQQRVTDTPEVKQFIADKKLVLGSGDRAYNYEISNPQELLNILFDNDAYHRAIAVKDEKGNPVLDQSGNPVMNYKKMMKAAALLKDDAEYDRLLISHGISLGAKGIIDSVEHPETQKQGGNGQPDTIWQAMRNAKIS